MRWGAARDEGQGEQGPWGTGKGTAPAEFEARVTRSEFAVKASLWLQRGL